MANLLSTTVNGQLNTGNVIDLGYTVNGSIATTAFRGINFHSFSDGNYLIGKRAGAWTQPLDITFYTGIRYHAHQAYGGHKFYTGGFDSNFAFSIGDGDANVRITNTLIFSSSNGTMISNGAMSDAIGWNSSYGTYIGSTVGGTYYIYGNGRFYDNGTIRTLIHSGNIGSQSVNYANTAGTAGSANTFQGFTAYNLIEEARGVHSFSDFVNGTLVTTDINASEWAGDSFVMEVSGKSYGSGTPFKLAMEGYLYANTIINVAAMSYGSYFPSPVKVMNLEGNLAFWWPRGSYWNSFEVHVRVAGGESWNRVTGISDSADPASATKKVSVTPVQVIHTNNIGSQSVNYATSAGTSTTSTHLSGRTDSEWYNVVWGAGNPSYMYSADSVRIRSSDGALRANIYYDNNDTGYYLDPNGSSNLNAVTANQYYANGWFRTYSTNGLYNESYGNHWYATSNATWNAAGNNGGYVEIAMRTGGHQGPIRGYFYADNSANIGILNNAGNWSLRTDSSRNTEIYGSLQVNSGTSFSGNTSWFGGYGGGSGPGIALENLSTFARFAFWGLDFYDWNHGIQMTIDNGYVSAANSFRAPIFYDSNDTTYYLDPNSSGTSLKINGGIVSTAGNGAVLLKHENSEANAWIFRENSANWGLFWFNAGGESGQTIGSYTTVGAELFGMNNAVTGFNPNSAWSGTDASTRAAWMLSNYSGYLWTQGTQYSETDMRAPIFYDSQNTGYYGDFASTSRFNATITNTTYFGADSNKGYAQGWNTWSSTIHKIAYVSFDWNGNYDTYSNHGIASTDYAGNFSDSVSINSFNDITFRLDSNNNNGASYVRFMNDTTGNNTFSSIGYDGSTYYASFSRDLYVNGNRGGNFGNRLIIGAESTPYTLQDTNLRPTAYLRGAYPVLTLDHTETGNGSHGPTIQFVHNGSATNNRQWVIGTNGTGTQLDFGYSDSSNYGNSSFNPHNGIADYLGVTWMRIDTSGNVSKVNSYQLRNGFTISQGGSNYGSFNSWVFLNGAYGFFSGVNNAHIYPNDQSYGAWRIVGTRNGWNGINFDASNGYVALMIDPSSNTSGFHNQSYGWQFRWAGGTLYCNKNAYGGGTDATVLDSSNSVHAANMNQYVRTSDTPTFAGLNAYDGIVKLNEIRFTDRTGSTESDPYTLRWVNESSARGAGLSWLEFQLNDDWNEEIRIYGNSCSGYSCGTYSDNLYHRFRADGYAWHAGTVESPNVNGTTRVYGPEILVNGHSDNTRGYRIHNTSGTSVSAMFTNSSNQLVIAAGALDQINLNKKVYVNGVALGVNVAPSATAGRIDASNDIVAYSSSDERLKYNIAPIENALDKVKSLTGVEFDWKPEYKHAHGYEGHDTGIIAQQVEAVMPSAVRTNDTGFLAVRYEKLIGLLIEGMKEQQAQIDELKAKLDGLTK